MSKNLHELEGRIGYRFTDRQLYPGHDPQPYANEHRWNKLECNERLEFLGMPCWRSFPAIFIPQISGELPEGDFDQDPCQHCMRTDAGLLRGGH